MFISKSFSQTAHLTPRWGKMSQWVGQVEPEVWVGGKYVFINEYEKIVLRLKHLLKNQHHLLKRAFVTEK